MYIVHSYHSSLIDQWPNFANCVAKITFLFQIETLEYRNYFSRIQSRMLNWRLQTKFFNLFSRQSKFSLESFKCVDNFSFCDENIQSCQVFRLILFNQIYKAAPVRDMRSCPGKLHVQSWHRSLGTRRKSIWNKMLFSTKIEIWLTSVVGPMSLLEARGPDPRIRRKISWWEECSGHCSHTPGHQLARESPRHLPGPRVPPRSRPGRKCPDPRRRKWSLWCGQSWSRWQRHPRRCHGKSWQIFQFSWRRMLSLGLSHLKK